MKLVILVVIFFFVVAVENCMDPAPTPASGLFFRLYYKTKDGADLLNPKTIGSYYTSSISVSNFFLNKDGTQTTYLARIGGENSCDSLVCNSIGGHFIAFLGANSFINTNSFTVAGALIKLSSTLTDTLTFETTPANAGFFVSKIFYRKNLIWSMPSPWGPINGIPVTVVK